MTREEAEKIVRGITDKIECNTADIDDWAELWGFTKEEYEEFLDMAKKALEQESKTGHWITKIKSDLRGDMWPTNPKCSECGGEPYYSNTIYNYKFCPYCGAKMESENKE